MKTYVDTTPSSIKIGNWVEYLTSGGEVITARVEGINGRHVHVKPPFINRCGLWLAIDGTSDAYGNSILRWLNPDQVSVKITLEGTVRHSNEPDQENVFYLTTENDEIGIFYEDIDPRTQTIVRDIIKRERI